MTSLLICPSCQDKGRKEVLGKFNDDGSFEILRFRNATTRVLSGEMEIQCGVCNEVVFFRIKKNGQTDNQGGQS